MAAQGNVSYDVTDSALAIDFRRGGVLRPELEQDWSFAICWIICDHVAVIADGLLGVYRALLDVEHKEKLAAELCGERVSLGRNGNFTEDIGDAAAAGC